MSNKIYLSEAKTATRQLPRMLRLVEKFLKPFLFADSLKEEVENFKLTLLSIADTEISFLQNQARIEPAQKQIRAERMFTKAELN